MAQVSRAANKTKFQTGDVPTQADFVDVFDSTVHFSDDIDTASTLDTVGKSIPGKDAVKAYVAAAIAGVGGGLTTEQIQDLVANMLPEATYDDGAGTITLPDGGGGLTTEQIQDLVGAMLPGATYDDATGIITLPTSSSGETAASLGTLVSGASTKSTPVDDDIFSIFDSAASWITKKLTWANIRSALLISGTTVKTINGNSIVGSGNLTLTNNMALATEATSSYTPVIGDAGKAIEMNVASANTFTVPPSSSVDFPIGTEIVIIQKGIGQTSIVAGAGVTIRSSNNALKLSWQYSFATVFKVSADTWYLTGDLAV